MVLTTASITTINVQSRLEMHTAETRRLIVSLESMHGILLKKKHKFVNLNETFVVLKIENKLRGRIKEFLKQRKIIVEI